MGIRILHTADWHIGSYNGPQTSSGENARYLDVCNCITTLIEEAKEKRPDIVIIAGDVFHQAKVWSDRGLKENQFAITALRQLETICPVVVMRGTPNHDSAEQFNALQTAFKDSSRINIVTEPGITTYDTVVGKIQVACVPGFDRGYYRAKNPGLSKEEENEVFTDAIGKLIIGMKAQSDSSIPSVLVGHYTITGCNMESGQTAFLSQFEPVVYPETLNAAAYDLVCFGHIHRPQKLEGCNNTFYCGAVSALNFNDESQKRGYYIHDIQENGSVTSEFFNLPTREFKTIRLEDGDVAEINNGNMDFLLGDPAYSDFPEKIIRVIYNCTDEHNKAFNHAVLENFLRTNGAYWVQEITPEKITITVDRNKMDADDSPEANLTAYLEEKSIEQERIGELVDLARPIIAEATEKSTSERKTGTFVPVEIEVKNYRNYREEKFSYDSIRFCTINGQNGVGKSSLFMDAMIDCLYEEPREGDLTGWICNDPDARSGSIKFTFRLGDSLYRITRTRAKSGKATLNIAEMVDGEWTDRSMEKFKDTQKAIENIIGMDSLTLKACALIMQDQYGLFLQADKEARMNILGSILGLGIYSAMEEIASAKLTETNREIRANSDKIEVLTADLPDISRIADEIAYCNSCVIEGREKATEAAETLSDLKMVLENQREIANRVFKLNSRITTLTGNMAAKESQKTSQMAIITGADSILSQEADIVAGVQHYNELCEREKTASAAEIEHKALMQSLERAKSALSEKEREAYNARSKADGVAIEIKKLDALLGRKAELEQIHSQYVEIRSKISAMEDSEAEYKAKSDAVKIASEKLSELTRRNNETEYKLRANIAGLEQKTAMLENSGCPDIENATCRFLKDAQEAKAQLPGLRASLEDTIRANAEMVESATRMLTIAREDLGKVLYDPDAISALRADLRALEASEREYQNIHSLEREKANLTERLEELGTAHREAAEKAESIRAEIAELEQKVQTIAEQVSNLNSLRNDIAIARCWLDKEKQLPLAKEKKSIASDRLFELMADIEAIGAEIEEVKVELEKEKANISDTSSTEMQIKQLESEIRSLYDSEQATTVKIGGLKKQQEQAEECMKKADELRKLTNKLGVTAAGYEELKKAFSQDGIPHNIIRSIIPIFEATATNILGQMSGGNMSVEFVTEKTLKSNNKKEVTTLDIIINDFNTGRLPYMSRSGGERVKAALSVILALAEIKSNKAGIQLGFLFIDEPPFLDQQGVQAYCDALETIQNRYSALKIMAITHDPAMKARFPQSLDVIKTPDGSKVIY